MATPATKDELKRAVQDILDHSIGVTAGAALKGLSFYTLQKALLEGELGGR